MLGMLANVPNRGVDTRGISYKDAYHYSRSLLETPKVQALFDPWSSNLKEPFRGITTDGNKQDGMFHIGDEGAPTAAVVSIFMCLIRVERLILKPYRRRRRIAF